MPDHVWLIIGLIAQLLFFARFLVQWLVSERRGQSTIPVAFWYFSLGGGLLLLAYSIKRGDPVFILGQSLGLIVYIRNIMLLGRKQFEWLKRFGSWLMLGLFALVLGLAFLGTRGLWEPDEGRYAESAREMLLAGDVLTPRLGGEPYFAKPPLTHMLIAGTIDVLGPNEAAVRLPTALAFAATVVLVAAIGKRMWDHRTGLVAGVVYATFLTTFAAANIVTPDTLLVLWEALALYAFWRGFMAQNDRDRRLWPIVTGLAFGLAMLTKGPPGLLFLPAMLIFRWLPAGRRPGAAPVLSFMGVFVFLAVGFSWYLYSVLRHPGLLSYFLGEEVVGRMAGQHHRNHEWYGPLVIYGPVLLLGTLPWCLTWPGIARRWRAGLGGERLFAALAQRPRALWLALTFVVPLVVLSISRSRLPLYLLPLFVPLALVTARGMLAFASQTAGAQKGGLLRTFGLLPGAWSRALPVWVVVLLGARLAFAMWPSEQDARHLYRLLPREQGAELVLTDPKPHYGLAFYYARAGDSVKIGPPSSYAGGTTEPSLLEEIAEDSRPTSHPHLYVVPETDGTRVEEMLRAAGATIRQTHQLPGAIAVLTARRGPAPLAPAMPATRTP